MSESGLYAPGTEHDPRAPWNQSEPVECQSCLGAGWIGVEVERRCECPCCEGTGWVDPNPPEPEFEYDI